ncbi:type II secretion system F family protein, partial [Streptomyces nodosus]
MKDPALLALGATVLAGTLALAGAHLYASGRAQRRALVDR